MQNTTKTLTPTQIAWASGHDWFAGFNPNGTLLVRDEYTQAGQLFSHPATWIGSFAELTRWAGY